MVALHDSEEWCKTWRGIYFLFQNWHDDLDKFWPKHSKGLKISKRFTLMNFFWPKYKFELKKYRKIMFDGTEDWSKTWRKTTCAFKNGMRSLAHF